MVAMKTNKKIITFFNDNVADYLNLPKLPISQKESEYYDSIIEVMKMTKREAMAEIANYIKSQKIYFHKMIKEKDYEKREKLLDDYYDDLHMRIAKIKWD